MAYLDCNYYYPTNYVTAQCDPQSYYYLQQYYYNAYQNQLRKLQNREVTMEYWTRQLEYFRNLLKNFSAQVQTPDDLKKLMASCNYDANIKKCFEKRRTFYNIDKKNCQCCCKACLEKTLLRLCNALCIPWPCNKCNCQKRPCCANNCYPNQQQQPPCSQPCYYVLCQTSCQMPNCTYYSCPQQQPPYVPCQTSCQMPNCTYYTYPQQQQQHFDNTCCYSQQYNNTCQRNCGTCCNKCKFKYILNKINWILTSAEQLKGIPCTCTCACRCACNMPPAKSCCSIKEIKEETITIKRETEADKNRKKSTEHVTKKLTQQTTECDCSSCSLENSDNTVAQISAPPCQQSTRVSFNNPKSDCECAIRKSRKLSSNYSSGAETINDASNISDEYKNYDSCFKKQASIVLGENYISPSGTFEVLIQDQNQANNNNNNNSNSLTKKKQNGNYMFQVDYVTYTKPKSNVENEI